MKKYPELAPKRVLADLIASTPGEQGKWFATAKSLKFFDLAIELALRSPADPRTLARAARDHLATAPAFALDAALLALHWIAHGVGYEITALEVRDACCYAREAGKRLGRTDRVETTIRELVALDTPPQRWMRQVLGLAGDS